MQLQIVVQPTTTLAQAARYARSLHELAVGLARQDPEFTRYMTAEDLARYLGDLAGILERFSAIAQRSGWTGPVAELFPARTPDYR